MVDATERETFTTFVAHVNCGDDEELFLYQLFARLRVQWIFWDFIFNGRLTLMTAMNTLMRFIEEKPHKADA